MAEKPLAWLKGRILSPPFSRQAQREAGYLLGLLQCGLRLGMPHSRPMPSIGPRCHELRVRDETKDWRIIYRIDADVIPIIEVFEKKSRKTPDEVVRACKKRLSAYDGRSTIEE